MNRVLLLDGGTGSELRRRGIAFRESCWSAAANLEHQDVLTSIHKDYVGAGADIVTANTFATSRFVLAAGGLADRFLALNQAALGAAKRAMAEARRPLRLAASLSCCPPFLDQSAYPDTATEYRDYCELADFLADQQVDLILLEMLQHPRHASLACRAAQATGLPYWAGVCCRLDPKLVGFDESGVAFKDILDTILPFEPTGITIMHSPPNAVLPALTELRMRWSGPIGAYAEIPYDEDPAVASTARFSPADYAGIARQWLEHDLQLLGGCCGTTPGHIAALRSLLDDSR